MQTIFSDHWPAFLTAFIGLLLFYYAVTIMMTAKKTRNWIQVPGKVDYSEVIETPDSFNDSRSGPTFGYSIVYVYSVAGETFRSEQLFLGPVINSTSKASAMKLKEKYKLFSDVVVYYNPQNPKESVIETGISGSILFLLIISLMILMAAVFIFYYQNQ